MPKYRLILPCKNGQRVLIFFNSFTTDILYYPISNPRILELGSGPGFLAQHVLDIIPVSKYVALDFSEAMHQLT